MKHAGERSAGIGVSRAFAKQKLANPPAAFDVAGAGNVMIVRAPVLDSTDEGGQARTCSLLYPLVARWLFQDLTPLVVLFSNEGHEIYSIDHDSYSVSAYNLNDHSLRVFDVAPLGYGGFAKPHYAALNAEGHLLLPIQGRTLLQLNPKTGEQIQIPLSAQTHQHGVALSNDASTLFIVGIGPAGEVNGAAALSRINLRDGRETHIPLHSDHEQIVLSDDGKIAYLTGGNSFTEGWNGISVIDLTRNQIHSIPVEKQPLGIALWKKYGK